MKRRTGGRSWRIGCDEGQIERVGREQQIPLLLRRAGRGSIGVGMTIYLKVTVSLRVTSALI